MTILSDIKALDAKNTALSQELIQSAKADVEFFKQAFEKIAAELEKRDVKIVSLKEKLQIPVPKTAAPSDLREVISPSPRSPATTLIDYDRMNGELVQQILAILKDEQEFYMRALDALSPKIAQKDLEIQALEQKLQKPATNQLLRKRIDAVEVSYITDAETKYVAQNYVYMIYQQKLAEANQVQTISMTEGNREALQNDPLFKESAKEAFKVLGIHPSEIYTVVDSMISSNERNLLPMIGQYNKSPEKFPDPKDLVRKINSRMGLLEKIFGHFEFLKEYDRTHKKTLHDKKAHFSDFPFNHLGLFGGQLRFMLKTYRGFEKELTPSEKEKLDDEKETKRKEVKDKIKEIEDIQKMFFDLLNKCRLKAFTAPPLN